MRRATIRGTPGTGTPQRFSRSSAGPVVLTDDPLKNIQRSWQDNQTRWAGQFTPPPPPWEPAFKLARLLLRRDFRRALLTKPLAQDSLDIAVALDTEVYDAVRLRSLHRCTPPSIIAIKRQPAHRPHFDFVLIQSPATEATGSRLDGAIDASTTVSDFYERLHQHSALNTAVAGERKA
jgi:hypothetical protein